MYGQRKSTKIKALLDQVRQKIGKFNNPLAYEMWEYALQQHLDGDSSFLEFINQLEQFPVSIEEFIDSEDFYGALGANIWPEVRKSLIEMHSNWWRGTIGGAYQEAVFDGGTGTAKSFRAIISFCYWAHILLCMKNPQAYYRLSKEKPISMSIMGSTPKVIKRVLYMPVRNNILNMPWFKRYGKIIKHIEAYIHFPQKNIIISPAGTEDDSIIGEDVIGGMIDEVNFMNVVEKSKKASKVAGRAATYDQAQTLYTALVSRRQGRFSKPSGPQIGMIILSSSARYVNDFTDRRIKEISNDPDSSWLVYIHTAAQYEMIPKEKLDKRTFRVAIPNDGREPYIVEKTYVDPNHRVLTIPYSNYYSLFKSDVGRGLRDICGIRSASVQTFIKQPSKILDAISRFEALGQSQLVDRQNVILADESMPVMLPESVCEDYHKPRYIHVDLSKANDRCGIAMCRYDGLIEVQRDNDLVEYLPKGTIELAISIEPDKYNNIDLYEVRMFVRSLKESFGYPVVCVSYDNWQSVESRQQLNKAGIPTKELSVDKEDTAYKQFREALYDDRIDIVPNELLKNELMKLEYDERTKKIDHLPEFTKDCADAACGSYNLMLKHKDTFLNSGTVRRVVERRDAHRRTATRRNIRRR